MVQQVLAALEPAALELSLTAAQQLERERADLEHLWQQRRERAAYSAERAGRQYRLAEPETRLVVRQLEREWEERLVEQEAIRQLAAAIPALWQAPTTRAAERKEILRQVLQRVVVTTQGATEQVQIRLEWVGGTVTAESLSRPVARLEQLSYYPHSVRGCVSWRLRSLMRRRLTGLGSGTPGSRSATPLECVGRCGGSRAAAAVAAAPAWNRSPPPVANRCGGRAYHSADDAAGRRCR